VTEKDSLERIVELARKEGALEGRKLRSFVEALRDRARLILEERVEPLTKRADAFERESRWRAEIQQGLEQHIASLAKEADWRVEIQRGLEDEVCWRRAAMDALEARIAALEAERRAEVGRFLAEIDGLREEWRAASAAHDRLLAEITGLQAEMEGVRGQWRSASAAHDRLLVHHRSLVAQVAVSLQTVAGWLPWSYKRARARIVELAAALRKELP
jgi:chromosome segregation ATPase